MAEPVTCRIGEVEVTRGDSWVVSRFPDGMEVHAHPQRDAEDIARAASLGYGHAADAVDRMTRDHDVLHHLIAVTRGESHSPTLRGVADGRYVRQDVSHDEEVVVLLVQRLLNVGLDEVLQDYSV